MLKSSLLEIIRTFSKDELKSFEDFVRSPYFNKNENVERLFLEIKKYMPDFMNEDLEKEKIWSKLFPEKLYNYGILKNLIFDLGKLCENFLIIEHSRNDEFRNTIDLMTLLCNRGISKVLFSKIDAFEKRLKTMELAGSKYQAADYYDTLHKLQSMKAYSNRLFDPKSSSYQEIVSAGENFIYSFMIRLYKLYNNIDAFKDTDNYKNAILIFNFLKELNKNFGSNILSNNENKTERDQIILKCFFDMNLALYPDAAATNYQDFRRSFDDCIDLVSKADLQDLLVCLSNSLRDRYSKDPGSQINIQKEKFYIFNLEIEKGTYLRLNVVDENDFINYMLIAFSLGEFESIEKFYKKISDKIAEDKKINIDSLTSAYLAFGKKEFNESLKYLSKITHDFFVMKYYVKNLEIMNYYELNDFVSFSYLLDSYKHFLSGNKSVIDHHRQVAEGFFKIVNRMFKVKESFGKYEFQKLKDDANEVHYLQKGWIHTKLDELEKVNRKRLK
ncbi:MAG: hypothetical protein ABI462_11335 [Ignavibacteria bacterium]